MRTSGRRKATCGPRGTLARAFPGGALPDHPPGAVGAEGGGAVEGPRWVPKMEHCSPSTPLYDVLRQTRRKSNHLIDFRADNLRHVLRLYIREAREG